MTRLLHTLLLVAAAATAALMFNVFIETRLAPPLFSEAQAMTRPAPPPTLNLLRLARLTGLTPHQVDQSPMPLATEPLIEERLLGTLLDIDHPEHSLALVQSPTTLKVTTAMCGDFISGAEVVSIERSQVFARSRGQVRRVASTGSSSPATAGALSIDLQRTEVLAAINGFASDPSRPTLMPVLERGVTRGVRVSSEPRSFYRSLGLQQGDLITRINGEDLAALIFQGPQALQRLRTASSVDLELERNGAVLHRTFVLQ